METTLAIILTFFATGLIGILAWSLVTTIAHGRKIAVLEKSWQDFVVTIKTDITTIKEDIDKINTRLDQFIKNELDVLKDIAKNKDSL